MASNHHLTTRRRAHQLVQEGFKYMFPQQVFLRVCVCVCVRVAACVYIMSE